MFFVLETEALPIYTIWCVSILTLITTMELNDGPFRSFLNCVVFKCVWFGSVFAAAATLRCNFYFRLLHMMDFVGRMVYNGRWSRDLVFSIAFFLWRCRFGRWTELICVAGCHLDLTILIFDRLIKRRQRWVKATFELFIYITYLL